MAAEADTVPGVVLEATGHHEECAPDGQYADVTPVYTKLAGGYLNHVYRLQRGGCDAVVKVHQSLPGTVSLSLHRGVTEARALEALSADAWKPLKEADVGVPGFLWHEATDAYAATMMRFVPSPAYQPLDLWWTPGKAGCPDPTPVYTALGRFHAAMHHGAEGWLSLPPSMPPALPEAFHNPNVQEVRAAMMFNGVAARVAPLAASCPPATATALNAAAAAAASLGGAFAGGVPGSAFTHGDAWLRSYLVRAGVDSGPLVVAIDWEFAHWGQPVQDVGHLLAHTWMQVHAGAAAAADAEAIAPLEPDAQYDSVGDLPWTVPHTRPLLEDACPGAAAWTAYLGGYGAHCAVPLMPEWGQACAAPAVSAALLWAGAELLVRAEGPFGAGFLYRPGVDQASSLAAMDATLAGAAMLLAATGDGQSHNTEGAPAWFKPYLEYADELYAALLAGLPTVQGGVTPPRS